MVCLSRLREAMCAALLRRGLFRCRVCHDLAYRSTRETPGERAWRREEQRRPQISGETP